jgi:hypothetical protein
MATEIVVTSEDLCAMYTLRHMCTMGIGRGHTRLKNWNMPPHIAPQSAEIYKRERLLKLRWREGQTVTSIPASPGQKQLFFQTVNSAIEALWYRADAETDGHLLHYLRLAARTAPRRKKSLPALTPEYLPSLPVFARRFFEAFFARLKPGTVVVIDDFHATDANPVFIEIVGWMIDALPAFFRFFVLSREAPPADYSRLKLNGYRPSRRNASPSMRHRPPSSARC